MSRALFEMFKRYPWFFIVMAIIITVALDMGGVFNQPTQAPRIDAVPYNATLSPGNLPPTETQLAPPTPVQKTICETMSWTVSGTTINVAHYKNQEETIECPDLSNATSLDTSFITPGIQVLCMSNVAGLGTVPVDLWVKNHLYSCSDTQH